MGGPIDSPYEIARQQRIAENKKRLQELGIKEISESFVTSSLVISPGKNSPLVQSKGSDKPSTLVKEKVKVQLRRSTRNTGHPQPEYQEVEVEVRRRARFENGGSRHYSRLYERKYASDEARLGATSKAESIKENLPLSRPSFVKPMLQSHVTGGFWLGLPVSFCRNHMPTKDERIVLVDENNEEWETIYLSNKTGLSGGWRGFSLDHGLVDGDALIFELVQPHKFKVHIVRVSEPDVKVRPITLMEQDVKEIEKNELPNDLSKQQQCYNKIMQRQKLTGETVLLQNEEPLGSRLLSNEKPDDLSKRSIESGAYRVKEEEAVKDLLCNESPPMNQACRMHETIIELPDAGDHDASIKECIHNNEIMQDKNTSSKKRKLDSLSDDDLHESKRIENMTSYFRSRKQEVIDQGRKILFKRIKAC